MATFYRTQNTEYETENAEISAAYEQNSSRSGNRNQPYTKTSIDRSFAVM
jgi:hypothetical protein